MIKSRKKIYFIFRQKQTTHFKKHKGQYQKLAYLRITPGIKIFFSNIYMTKNKGFGRFNLAGYWKRKYNQKVEKEPMYISHPRVIMQEFISVNSEQSTVNS